ncbi:hypothetical protein I4U23_005065 [Adineta vaga]|nr:hypothetical protein I4U23_005065 [Adineta vaga]
MDDFIRLPYVEPAFFEHNLNIIAPFCSSIASFNSHFGLAENKNNNLIQYDADRKLWQCLFAPLLSEDITIQMATNDCIVHSRKNLSNFHTTIAQLRCENKFTNNIYQELSNRCCSCNGKTGLNIIDLNVLINICEEIQSKLLKSSYDLTLSFELEADFRERRARIGRFIEKNGQYLRYLQNKYNINIQIRTNFSGKKIQRKFAKIQDDCKSKKMYLFITNKKKSTKNSIPIDKIEKQSINLWINGNETRNIREYQSSLIELNSDNRWYQKKNHRRK